MRNTVAAFDVDGTVTDRDCVIPFMRRVTGAPRVGLRLAARPDRFVPALVRRDRDQLKALAAAAAFRGQRYDHLADVGATFAQSVHDHRLRADTMAKIRAHIESADRVVFVSASFEVYVRPLAELLGVHDVLATRLMVREGIVTGELDGPNCRGPEKVRRLHEWLRSEYGARDRVRLVAYGDSAGDREMLADADASFWLTADGTAA